jgi:glycosyltransferase involved in cell wall biosynthesis
MAKFSIAIPTCNSEKFLKQTIESVLNQTYKDFELIICDDNSTDGTIELASFYADKDKRIRCFQNPNRLGLFPNFNQCIKYASGEYINILGHDDVMLPRNLEVKCQIFETYPNVGIVASSVDIINDDGNLVDLNWGQYERDSLELGKQWVINKVSAHNPICCPFVFLRRQTIEQAGLFSEQYSFVGDFEMWLRVALHADIYFVKEVLGYFRWHQQNESHRYDALYYLTEVSKIWDEIIDRLNLQGNQLLQMEDRIIKNLFDHFVVSHFHDLDYALKMCQVLDKWRTHDRKLSLAVQSLGNKIIELNQSIAQSQQMLVQSEEKLQSEINQLNTRIEAMKTSKFWSLRKKWFKLKQFLGLAQNEAF